MRPRLLTLSAAALFPVLCTLANAQERGRAGMRFAGMDTDRDGVITRTEWRGSESAFRTHDWNGDGVLSGDELRPGARRRQPDRRPQDFETADREYRFDDWTSEGFAAVDHDRNGQITRDEWHFDRESFRRADHDGDGRLSRREFLGDVTEDDDREHDFRDLDENRDGRVSREEWHGSRGRFDALDTNRDGTLTRAETAGSPDAPPDLFTSLDVNRDASVSWDEWHWSRQSFDRRDVNRNGRITRAEFTETAADGPTRSAAYKAGYERGLIEGRAAGREDRERNQGWDLDGQRELEQADSGYEDRFGARGDYQAGYRDGFRRSYREGYGPR